MILTARKRTNNCGVGSGPPHGIAGLTGNGWWSPVVGRLINRPVVPSVVLMLVAIIAGGAALGVHLLVSSGWSPLRQLDLSVLHAMEAHVSDAGWLVFGFKAVSAVTVPLVYQVGAVVAALALVWHRRPRSAAYVLLAVLPAMQFAPVIKEWVRRDRPSVVDPWAGAGGYSFPSGHALCVSAAASVLVAMALLLATKPVHRAAAVVVAVVSVIGVCAARVALGVHYFSDVAAGFLIGTGWVCATMAAALPLLRRDYQRGARA